MASQDFDEFNDLNNILYNQCMYVHFYVITRDSGIQWAGFKNIRLPAPSWLQFSPLDRVKK